ncbi:DNA-binding protein [Leptospira stimsonii]|uniref:DNA-binding protein n=1 Tax=Leptospira stimsonii TaxID=2202203 RepID=A0A4R9L4U7_9LEPT|nr:DNA-binding protein [Leptospira stimsonii]RHX86035.1 DNA-binding protein [Leptospira stimsonii]TGK19769.1 DNA-binding protein [Leptospira stimsonii]TGM13767.1 DNA-binding protein [Leptospira stimsonii]
MPQKRNDQDRNFVPESGTRIVSGYAQDGSLYKTSLNQNRKSERIYKGLPSDPAIPKDPKDTMTPKEVAALLKRTIRRVGDYRREGLLGKFWRLRDGRVLYSRIGVEEFFRNHFVESEEGF